MRWEPWKTHFNGKWHVTITTRRPFQWTQHPSVIVAPCVFVLLPCMNFASIMSLCDTHTRVTWTRWGNNSWLSSWKHHNMWHWTHRGAEPIVALHFIVHRFKWRAQSRVWQKVWPETMNLFPRALLLLLAQREKLNCTRHISWVRCSLPQVILNQTCVYRRNFHCLLCEYGVRVCRACTYMYYVSECLHICKCVSVCVCWL